PLMICRFHPAGAFVFATAEDRKIYRWALADGKRGAFAGHASWGHDLALAGQIRTVAVSPDGQLLASGGNDRVVRIWNAQNGTKVREMTGHERDIYTIIFHPSGQWLLSGDLDGKIKQWEVSTGNLVRTFEATALHT